MKNRRKNKTKEMVEDVLVYLINIGGCAVFMAQILNWMMTI